jgi:hypothetical protein
MKPWKKLFTAALLNPQPGLRKTVHCAPHYLE